MPPSLHSSWFLTLCVLSLYATLASSSDSDYAKSLLKFKQSLTNATVLDQWGEPADDLCSWDRPNWNGVLCVNDSFVGLKLEGMGLGGKLDMSSLSELPILTLSVMHNNFSGPFPSGIRKLNKLRSLFLANNSFSGEIPNDAFKGMKALRKVVLGYNSFAGKIPMSLLGLPKLVELQLQNNQFHGRIPDFWQTDLTVNFANNKLQGDIPDTLSNQNASSFSGNANLCGKPLDPCKAKKSTSKTAFIVAAAVGISLAILIILFLVFRRRAQPLYKELPSLTLPHGHLKSSNVLLDNTYEPILADFALVPVINKDHAQQFMVAYKSPESTQHNRVTRKTDVWSLGILILELLTGRFPANYLKQGRGASADLASWVNSVVREEWTGEVFDKEISSARNGEGQMLRLLKIGMCCCEWNVDKRWDLKEAVERIEELKERDSDDDYSSYASYSDGEVYSSKAVTDDDFSFSRIS